MNLDQPDGRVWLAGAGKASWSMALAASDLLGERLAGGLIVGTSAAFEGPLRCLQGSHPLPDERSLVAGRELRDFMRGIPAEDSLVFMLSGGASSLLELPLEGISLAQLLELHRALLHSGAPIQEHNVVRAAFSQIKGGGLSGDFTTLVISDVVDAPLSVVGSGPTLGSPPDVEHVRSLLERYRISLSWDPLPFLRQRTVPPAGPGKLLGDVRDLVGAAIRAGEARGLRRAQYGSFLRGEARDTARELAAYVDAHPDIQLLVAGGETTVTVKGTGTGGRCQELALAFAAAAPAGEWTFLAAGSDGRDGATDAAGAWVDSQTPARASALAEALANNDAYPCLKALGQLIPAFDSGTNVNDLVLFLRG